MTKKKKTDKKSIIGKFALFYKPFDDDGWHTNWIPNSVEDNKKHGIQIYDTYADALEASKQCPVVSDSDEASYQYICEIKGIIREQTKVVFEEVGE